MPSLLDFPAELLDWIVDLVHHERPEQYLGAVHRTFLPRARPLLFRQTEATARSWKRLALLCEFVEAGTEIAAHLSDLTINLRNRPYIADLPLRRVLDLFVELSSLERLSLIGAPLIHTAILSAADDSVYTGLLQSLHHLHLSDTFAAWLNPFSPAHYRRLSRFPRLNSFSLDVRREELDPGPFGFSVDLDLDSTESWKVELRGPLAYLENSSAADLIHFFPTIHTLKLRDTRKDTYQYDFGLLLGGLAYPDELESLSLSFGRLPCYDFLELTSPPLRQLSTLELGRSAVWGQIAPILHQMHLETVVLHPRCKVTTAELVELLNTPVTAPHLKTIVLDNAWDTSEEYPEPCFPFDCGWSDPDFTADGLLAVVDLAKVVGVRVEGSAVEALEMELELREERRRAQQQ
ncbi:hypothetical protein JCM10213_007655 [Rhodosporidiobolus nylandii]